MFFSFLFLREFPCDQTVLLASKNCSKRITYEVKSCRKRNIWPYLRKFLGKRKRKNERLD